MSLAAGLVKLAKHRKPLWIPYGGTKVLIDSHLITFPILDMLLRGRYEHFEFEALRILKTRGLLTRNDRALELGVGAGVIGLQIATIVGDQNYVGYEANPAVLDLARRNFTLNGMSPDLRRKLLLPGGGGPQTFAVSSNFTASALEARADTIGEVSVEADAFEDVLKAFDPTLLVMDIEGGEKAFFAAAGDFGNIRLILLENHFFGADRPVFDGIVARLGQHDFREAKEIYTSASVHLFLRG
jgi:hypothetical protein